MNSPNASVLILTRNEEHDLAGCLDSVAWSDDVHVFDSLSTDRTPELAVARGARLTQRAFDGYASQRNAALHGLDFRHEWVLSLDADERVPEPLTAEVAEFTRQAPESFAAARIRRRDYFLGRWLKHAQISPYYVRLVRPRRVRYEREVNEVLVADGAIHGMREPFDHHPFSKGLRHWIDKHNRYSTMEAQLIVEARRNQPKFSLNKALFASDFNERRLHQKGLFYRVPCRPLLKFAYMMLARRAFLDGTPGVTYAVLQSVYEYFIVLKTKEASHGVERKSPTPAVLPGQVALNSP